MNAAFRINETDDRKVVQRYKIGRVNIHSDFDPNYNKLYNFIVVQRGRSFICSTRRIGTGNSGYTDANQFDHHHTFYHMEQSLLCTQAKIRLIRFLCSYSRFHNTGKFHSHVTFISSPIDRSQQLKFPSEDKFDTIQISIIMSVLFLLLAASLSIAVGFLVVFIVSAKRGQFDDDYTPSIRMLSDDHTPKTDSTNTENQENV